MSLAVAEGSDLGKSPILGQPLSNQAIPWNTLLAPSNAWLKDLYMKRLEALAYDNTLFSERLERRAGDGIFQKGEICALITHTCHFILSKSVSCS